MRWKFRTKRGSPRPAAAPPRSVPLSPSSSRFVWPQCERGPSTATTARVRKRAKGNGDNAARRSGGCRDFDITEIDITESDVTETDITENDITESDITESDIT